MDPPASWNARTIRRERALVVYDSAKLDRLMAIKRRSDPENLFRINHDIPPAG